MDKHQFFRISCLAVAGLVVVLLAAIWLTAALHAEDARVRIERARVCRDVPEAYKASCLVAAK